jgi:hypothetical protein
MTTDELRAMCADLETSAARAVPGGAGQAAIKRELARVASALDAREPLPARDGSAT